MKGIEEDYKDGSVDDFVNFLFTGDVKPKGSVQFQTQQLNNRQLFLFLVDVLHKAFKLVHGDENGYVNLRELSDHTDIYNLIKRFNSFGFNFNVQPDHETKKTVISYASDDIMNINEYLKNSSIIIYERSGDVAFNIVFSLLS